MLPHASVDQRSFMAVGWLLEEFHARRFGGQRQRTHSVHDEVDPEELGGDRGRARQRLVLRARRVHKSCNVSHLQHGKRLLASDDRADEYDDQSCTINRQLELEELADVVKDSSAPQHSFDDGREVVIEDDDVCSLLGHFGA